MAGLERLTSMIYHEKQEAGSMLCAQHALNSLMQGNYFQASDLSEIARNLDALEAGYDDDNAGQTSTNMDDTGFFSVQVLEGALKVWGLTARRWRSEEMRAYADRPYTQLAFVLNLEQHWFTLRRFGPAQANLDADPGIGHWFNLNSFLAVPEWVSRTYLGMVLQQAEAEGYSVFAICQVDSTAPLALPRVDADEIAETLPQPTSSSTSASGSGPFPGTGRTLSTSRVPSTSSGVSAGAGPSSSGFQHFDGLEDEDMELQAALQASMGYDVDPAVFAATASSRAAPSRSQFPSEFSEGALGDFAAGGLSGFGSGTAFPPTGLRGGLPPIVPLDAHDPDDPVAASMARNRAIMQRMMAEQASALRGAYDDEVQDRFYAPVSGAGPSSSRRRAVPPPIAARRRDEDDDEEMEEDEEDEAYIGSDEDGDGGREDEPHPDSESGSGEARRSTRTRRQPPPSALFPGVPPNTAAPRTALPGMSAGTAWEEIPEAQEGMTDEEYAREVERVLAASQAQAQAQEQAQDQGRDARPPGATPRVYDDEDAELQAALRASLEGLPEDFTFPDSPPPSHALPSLVASGRPGTAPPPPTAALATPSGPSTTAAGGAGFGREESMEPEAEEEQLSMDEIRRRRLARFGG